MYRLLLSFALAATTGPLAASPSGNGEKLFQGPMRYCGNAFAIVLADGERISWRNPVHDFDLHFLESPGGNLSIYEGNHPQTFENERTRIRLTPFRRVERLHHPERGYSYLIQTGERWPAFVHLFGQGWQGSDADFPLIRRLAIGDGRTTQCTRATARAQHEQPE